MDMPLTSLDLRFDIDEEPWKDLDGAQSGVVRRVCGIPRGTAHGNAAVAVAVQMEDGSWVIGQTTLRLLWNAVRALGIRYENDLK